MKYSILTLPIVASLLVGCATTKQKAKDESNLAFRTKTPSSAPPQEPSTERPALLGSAAIGAVASQVAIAAAKTVVETTGKAAAKALKDYAKNFEQQSRGRAFIYNYGKKSPRRPDYHFTFTRQLDGKESLEYRFRMITRNDGGSIRFISDSITMRSSKIQPLKHVPKDYKKINLGFTITLNEAFLNDANQPDKRTSNFVTKTVEFPTKPTVKAMNGADRGFNSELMTAPGSGAFSVEVVALETNKKTKEAIEKAAEVAEKAAEAGAGALKKSKE